MRAPASHWHSNGGVVTVQTFVASAKNVTSTTAVDDGSTVARNKTSPARYVESVGAVIRNCGACGACSRALNKMTTAYLTSCTEFAPTYLPGSGVRDPGSGVGNNPHAGVYRETDPGPRITDPGLLFYFHQRSCNGQRRDIVHDSLVRHFNHRPAACVPVVR